MGQRSTKQANLSIACFRDTNRQGQIKGSSPSCVAGRCLKQELQLVTLVGLVQLVLFVAGSISTTLTRWIKNRRYFCVEASAFLFRIKYTADNFMQGQVYIESFLLTDTISQQLISLAAALPTFTIIKVQEFTVHQQALLLRLKYSNPAIKVLQRHSLDSIQKESLLITANILCCIDSSMFEVVCLLSTNTLTTKYSHKVSIFEIRSIVEALKIFKMDHTSRRLMLEFNLNVRRRIEDLTRQEKQEKFAFLAQRYLEHLQQLAMVRTFADLKLYLSITKHVAAWNNLRKSRAMMCWRIYYLEHQTRRRQMQILSCTAHKQRNSSLLRKVFLGWQRLSFPA